MLSETADKGQSLVIASSIDNLDTIRSFVESAAIRLLDTAKPAVDDLCLAVDEAVSNIIEHGYAGKEGHIEISIELQDQALQAVVRDAAPEFNPLSKGMRDLSVSPMDAPAAGGYGITLINKIMDKIEHRPLSSGGNELRLTKMI